LGQKKGWKTMVRIRNFIIPLAVAGSLLGAASAEAQWQPLSQPSQKFLRLAGHGFSAGYHWRNPGHRNEYYHPYSDQNTIRSTSQGVHSNWGTSHAYSLEPRGQNHYQNHRRELGKPEQFPEPTGFLPTGNGGEDNGTNRFDREEIIRRPELPARKPSSVNQNDQWPFQIDN